MRYVAGFLYGLAAFQGTGGLFNAICTGVCVAVGTVAALFAVEGIVKARGPRL